MAKNNNQMRMKGNQMYRRPTKGMQQNMMRNMPEMELPKFPSKKRIIIQHILVGVVIVGITIALMFLIHWAFSFLGMVAVLVYLLLVGRDMNKKQKELLQKYMDMGMTKKAFIRQLQMRKMTEKQMASTLRLWDSVALGDKMKRTWVEKLTGM